MIAATEADIGRRVVYRTPYEKARGTITGIEPGGVLVQFDHDDMGAGPLRVGSNLEWADRK